MEEAIGRLFGEHKLPGHLERRAEGQVSELLGMKGLMDLKKAHKINFIDLPNTKKRLREE